MDKLRVIYDKDRCIGAGICVVEDPSRFKMEGDKAELINSEKTSGNIFHLDLKPLDADDKEKLIVAARSCPVNAIGVIDLNTNEEIVTMDLSSSDDLLKVTAEYDEGKEWAMDPKGYFLIRVNQEDGLIEVGHCGKRNVVDVQISGKTATEIFNTIIRKNLISSLQHAAYLGKELYKAKHALESGEEYVQDAPKFGGAND